MALMERMVPLHRHDWGFFDDLYKSLGFKGYHWQRTADMMAQMDQQMANMDRQFNQQMETMRKNMFQLLPIDEYAGDRSPIILETAHPVVEEKGDTHLSLNFNVAHFKPEEVQVKVVGHNILQVHAKHEEKTDQGSSYREYLRQYQLPKGVDETHIKPSLTADGILTIEAPAARLKPEEKMIPIEFKK